MCRLIRPAIAVFLSSALLACASIKTGSHYNETVDFNAFQTFSWISEQPYILGDPDVQASPLTQTIIQDAIKTELERIGYQYTEDSESADLVLAYTVGTRDKIRVDSYPVRFHGSWGWHIPGSHFYVRESTTHSYSVGTLGVDMFDNKSHMPIWHGFAEKTIRDADRANPTPSIREGVSQLFSNFPQ